jgi:hypothetical protein
MDASIEKIQEYDMPKDQWKRANDRARYGPVRYVKKSKRNKPNRNNLNRVEQKKQTRKQRIGFEIPSGTVMSVCKASDSRRRWFAHKTKVPLSFAKEHSTPTVHGTSGAVIFKYQGWLILTRRKTCTKYRYEIKA